MRAVILAGGKGTRLAPYTVAFPKPLMPLGDVPILEVVVRQLAHRLERDEPPTPIVPVMLGDERRALAAAEALFARGLWVPAIRPPTVPSGTARLRITLSAAHDEEEVERLAAALAELPERHALVAPSPRGARRSP